MPDLEPGELNRRLTYQEPGTQTFDAYGQAVETPPWSDVATVWAKVRTPSAKELQSASQQQAVVDHVVFIRRSQAWRPSPIGRFTYSTTLYNPAARVLNITGVFDPDEGNTFWQVFCTEQTAPLVSA